MATPPEQLQDNVQLVGSVQDSTSGVFEQESVTVGQMTYINTGTTTTVKSGAGVLINIIIGNTLSGSVTVYDSLTGSGTIKVKINAGATPFPFQVGGQFTTGCTVVTTAADQLTIVWA